ncbi:hypothetical protein GCM10025859_23930 [Alicyclobacillus fastidiosus]|nr:hypothetical protein GCM10025859_23930 [Alicyclobacillus fastidiosus]
MAGTDALSSSGEPGVYIVDVPLHQRKDLADCVRYATMRQTHAYRPLVDSHFD